MNARERATPWPVIAALAAAVTIAWLAQLQRGAPLHWDEIEYFRATRWTSLGAVPFRDFWEHHTPLQWLVFAPLARLLARGSGADAVVAMRWAQLPCWIAVAVLLLRGMRRETIGATSRWCALVLLGAAPAFAYPAIEYRVDTLGTLLFLATFLLATRDRNSRMHWILYGAIMSLAVLANLRLAPLAAVAGLLALFVDDGRWRFRPPALWMTAGIATIVGIGAAALELTGAREAFIDGVFRYNAGAQRLVAGATGSSAAALLVGLVRDLDLAAIVLWIAGASGAALALRQLARPRLPQLVALLAIASTVFVSIASVHYSYHLQTTYVFLAFLAALALDRLPRSAPLALATAGAVLALLPLARPGFGAGLAYQDMVMREVDRRTAPGDRVWDGTGYALDRKPAYRYWFLPLGVRVLAQRGDIETYDAPQLLAAPPAAIVGGLRVAFWLEAFPALAHAVTRNYLPIRQDLWMPGPNALVDEAHPARWTAIATGRYRVVASDLLARHPWFRDPIGYIRIRGPRATELEVPVLKLPRPRATLALTINGAAVSAPGVVAIRRGDAIEIRVATPVPIGVLLVPERDTTLFVASPERVIF